MHLHFSVWSGVLTRLVSFCQTCMLHMSVHAALRTASSRQLLCSLPLVYILDVDCSRWLQARLHTLPAGGFKTDLLIFETDRKGSGAGRVAQSQC